jgi:hypothetical protein
MAILEDQCRARSTPEQGFTMKYVPEGQLLSCIKTRQI